MLENFVKVCVVLIKNITNLKACASSNARLSLHFVIELNVEKIAMLER